MAASCIRCVPKRYWITFLVFIGKFLAVLRTGNVIIAFSEMTREDVGYRWDEVQDSIIIKSFYYGLFLSFLGAYLINSFGGAKILGIGTAITGALDLLSPFLINIHWLLFLLCRVIQGVIMGIATCSDVDIFARWSPTHQRTRLLIIAYLGGMIGLFVMYLIYLPIASVLGWQAIFYATGIASVIWSVIWFNSVSNDSANDKCVQDAERNVLVPKKGEIDTTKLPIPWRQILSSKSVYVVFFEHFTGSLVPGFTSGYLIVYISDLLGIRGYSILSSISVLFNIIAMLVAAFLSDYLRSHGIMKSKIHKNYHLYGEIVILLSLLAVALLGHSKTCITISVCCLQIACAFILTSDLVLCIDMAGQHAAVIRSIGATITYLGIFLHNEVVGGNIYSSNFNWNWYILILSGISLFGVILFTISGPGELQSWASEAEPAEKEGERETNLGGNRYT